MLLTLSTAAAAAFGPSAAAAAPSTCACRLLPASLLAWQQPAPRVPLQIRLCLDEEDDGSEEKPWWKRPPRVWPPRVDAPSLILGDVAVSYFAAYLALDVLTTGRAADWQAEGSALASSWLVAAAVTNAWDPTAVLPSLGLRNALGCVSGRTLTHPTRIEPCALCLCCKDARARSRSVDLHRASDASVCPRVVRARVCVCVCVCAQVARASVDLASTRLVFALAGAVLAQRAVDVKVLALELALEVSLVMLWRSGYTSTSNDWR